MTTPIRLDLLARHGVVTLDQLRAAGLTYSAVRHLVRTGRLYRIHRAVFAVGRPQLSREGRWLAAVLAAGDGALLCGAAAALLWDLLEYGDELPHVLVDGRSGRRGVPGVRLHRSITLLPGDAAERYGIPVTSVERTVLDLARSAPARTLRRAVRGAERRWGVDLAALAGRAATPATDIGAARLRRLLATYVRGPVESAGEEDFLALCVRHGLPLPKPQARFGPYRADFYWEDFAYVVEIDDARTHVTLVARAEDAARDRYLHSLGLEVARYPEHELRQRPAVVMGEVRAALLRRRGLGGSLSL